MAAEDSAAPVGNCGVAGACSPRIEERVVASSLDGLHYLLWLSRPVVRLRGYFYITC